MNEDERCCGTGTCILNAEGLCWCGQQWNGSTMCRLSVPEASASADHQPEVDAAQGDAP